MSKIVTLNKTKDEIFDLYINQGQSIKEISHTLSCSFNYLRTWMKKNNIPIKKGFHQKTKSSLNMDYKNKGIEDLSNVYWKKIVKGAKRKNLEIDISAQYIWDLFLKQEKRCALTGIPIRLEKSYKDNETKQTASLDRIDNNKGYIKGNVRWIYKDINFMKYTYEDRHFVNLCSLIAENAKSPSKKTVLILGGTGFLGHHVNTKIDKEKYNVISIGSKTCDLRDTLSVEAIYKLYRPNIIINLAAVVGGIQANKNYPATFMTDNTQIGINCIHHANNIKLDKFIQIGTTCSYGKHCPIPFKEESLFCEFPEETNAPYGIAKLLTLVMLQAYRKEYGLNGIYLIPTNLVGEFDNFNPFSSHVIPAIIRKIYLAIENKIDNIILFGSGLATRDFLYAGDCANAIISAMENYNGLEPINIGSGLEISIKDIATKISKIMNFQGSIIWNTTMPDGQPRRLLDITKAQKYLNFQPQTSIDESLSKTIDYFLQNKKEILAKDVYYDNYRQGLMLASR